jgi:hypothetical protein
MSQLLLRLRQPPALGQGHIEPPQLGLGRFKPQERQMARPKPEFLAWKRRWGK